jgi:hypothetical protein
VPSSFSWTIGTITGGITGASGGSGTTINQVLTNPSNTTAGSVEYIVTPTATTGSCPGSPLTITVTVNPTPIPPPSFQGVACNNSPATLTASGAIAGENYHWYNAAVGGTLLFTGNPYVTSTPPSATYWVSIFNSTCESSRTTITVTIQTATGAGAIAANQTIVAGAVPAPLTNVSAGSGSGVLTYEWQMSTDGGTTWTTIAGATGLGYSPPALFTTTLYQRRTVSTVYGVPCYSAWSNTVTITVNGEPNAGEIGYPQTICAGTIPAPLVSITPGSVTTPGATLTYLWEYSTDGGTTWLTAPGVNNGEDYTPIAPVNVTTIFRRRAISTINGVSASSSAYVTITVLPAPVLPAISVNNTVCDGTPVIFQGTTNPAYYYYLNYISGTLTPQNHIDSSNQLYFEVIPPPGIHVYSITARNSNGCESSQQFTVSVYGIPDVDITASCSSIDPGTGQYSGQIFIIGTLDNGNFPSGQQGAVQYSLDMGATWTSTNPLTVTNVPPGEFTLLTRNSAQDSCYAEINAYVLEQSILTSGVEICQGDPSQAMTAFSLCIMWSYESFFYTCTDPTLYYNASTNQNTYVAGPLVNYGSSMFRTPSDGIVNIKECPDNPNTTLSIYRTPFVPSQPDSNFILMRTNLCPGGAGQTLNLLPNTNYTAVLNNSGPVTPAICTKLQFTANHKGAVANGQGFVSWYYNGTLIQSNSTSYDPVAAGFSLIPNTNTPGQWLFHVSCEGQPCSQPVWYTINPYPIGEAIGDTVNCSNEITDILLRSYDNLGRQIPSYRVSYTWTSAVISGTASGNSSCSAGCDSIINDQIINNTTLPALIRYTILPKVGECEGLPFTFDLVVDPLPSFTALPASQTICPGAAITPIVITNTNTVSYLSYSWTRTDTLVLTMGSIPGHGTGSGSGFSISGNLPSTDPRNVHTTTFTIQALVSGHSCAEQYASVTVVDNIPPDIVCPPKITINCDESYDPAYTGTATATDNCDPNPVITYIDVRTDSTCINNYRLTRTWMATDASGNTSTCSQHIIVHDIDPPYFITNPVLSYTFCVHNIDTANYNLLPEPLADITPARPDWYTLTPADKSNMYMDPGTYFYDNCTPPPNLILHWRLDFNGGVPASISGTGQFSNYPGVVTFPGSPTTDVIHHLSYWLEDDCGNISTPEVVITITITPRPDVIKQY